MRIFVLKHRGVHRCPKEAFSRDVYETLVCNGAREVRRKNEFLNEF